MAKHANDPVVAYGELLMDISRNLECLGKDNPSRGHLMAYATAVTAYMVRSLAPPPQSSASVVNLHVIDGGHDE